VAVSVSLAVGVPEEQFRAAGSSRSRPPQVAQPPRPGLTSTGLFAALPHEVWRFVTSSRSRFDPTLLPGEIFSSDSARALGTEILAAHPRTEVTLQKVRARRGRKGAEPVTALATRAANELSA